MIPKHITRKLTRLRNAILREMTRIAERNAIITGVTCTRTLATHVVLDSPVEEHLRHAKGVHVGLDGVLYVSVFDNYDESTHDIPAESLPTDILLAILENL